MYVRPFFSFISVVLYLSTSLPYTAGIKYNVQRNDRGNGHHGKCTSVSGLKDLDNNNKCTLHCIVFPAVGMLR